MAGSYRHIVNVDNEFTGVDLIDNLGDAYEALEECYNMIKHLTGGSKVAVHLAWLEGHARPNYPPENEPLYKSYERFWDRKHG